MVMPLPEKERARPSNTFSRILCAELKTRSLWLIRLRWAVSPVIVAAVGAAMTSSYQPPRLALVMIAGWILCYNLLLWAWAHGLKPSDWQNQTGVQKFIYWQLGLDYLALLALIHLTGGIVSPLLYFCVFHILFAAGLLPRFSAFKFTAAAIGGAALITLGEFYGWMAPHSLTGAADPMAPSSFFQAGLYLFFFAVTLSITAWLATTVMGLFFQRMLQLDAKSEALADYNKRFDVLFAMIKTIGTIRHLDQILEITTHDLAKAMDIKAVSIKLLNEDGTHLVYKASWGLPEKFIKNRRVSLDQSPLNRRIIEGEPFITGRPDDHEMFQFGEDLVAARIQSVLFVPMAVEDKTIGVLGAYCVLPDRFLYDDIAFLRLAAGMVGIGIHNSKAYEAIENSAEERTRFMMRAAHNLRAPLSAVLSMLEVLRERHLGKLTPDQAEYLRRVDRRIHTMLDMINELMHLSTSRSRQTTPSKKPLDTAWLGGRLERTFQNTAAERKIDFKVTMENDLPPVSGNSEQIEQMLENLVSNAIKYTPECGWVMVAFTGAPGNRIAISISDSGIGIPEKDQSRLFTEFFRADNAREKQEQGTGLGLAIVKEIVDAHQGSIQVKSRENHGTTVLVTLPASQMIKEEHN
ncbi:GAF domain-containing sensor histidine kinase [Desulfotignum balticum]|uniref:GAF domain-containing sensor histidine kinase n=1 Tax=Desulfotignum balticum TaxID=115781 RepID=UPI0003FE0866|nr:GAF domain-containing sensor histidine kinase [Desulfotignum balticum]